jgi:hypothetical protein
MGSGHIARRLVHAPGRALARPIVIGAALALVAAFAMPATRAAAYVGGSCTAPGTIDLGLWTAIPGTALGSVYWSIDSPWCNPGLISGYAATTVGNGTAETCSFHPGFIGTARASFTYGRCQSQGLLITGYNVPVTVEWVWAPLSGPLESGSCILYAVSSFSSCTFQ